MKREREREIGTAKIGKRRRKTDTEKKRRELNQHREKKHKEINNNKGQTK